MLRGENMWNNFRKAEPAFEVSFDKCSLKNPWCVFEVRVDSNNEKHSKLVKGFRESEEAKNLCNILNKK